LDTTNRNALYVDYLELRNFTTNIDFSGNFAGVQVDPNMTIYFAQAVMNGASVAERLSGANGGRFCWVSNYAGIYSATNIVYSDGTTNALNAALVQSRNLDSDCDTLPNSVDPEPIFLVTTASLPRPRTMHRIPSSCWLEEGHRLRARGALLIRSPYRTGWLVAEWFDFRTPTGPDCFRSRSG
jgi:hypothetical protein